MRISWRRLFQFRLRTLLIVSITLPAVVGTLANRVYRQADAGATIVALGGFVDTNKLPGED